MLDLVSAQSDSYPKVWILTFSKPGSSIRQFCGQKYLGWFPPPPYFDRASPQTMHKHDIDKGLQGQKPEGPVQTSRLV